jgi:hypothetical protein
MPCQEPPIAMSTWQAAIHVPKGCTVLMSGNELAVHNPDDADIGMYSLFSLMQHNLLSQLYFSSTNCSTPS